MYLKWTSQNLTSFADSLSLESSFFLPSCKYDMSPFEVAVVCTDFIGKMISHRRESNAIRSPLIKKHMYLLRSFAPSTASRLAVTSFLGNGVHCTPPSPPPPHSLLVRFIKKSHFAWAILVRQLQLTPFCSVQARLRHCANGACFHILAQKK